MLMKKAVLAVVTAAAVIAATPALRTSLLVGSDIVFLPD